jgi:hypothetical protein
MNDILHGAFGPVGQFDVLIVGHCRKGANVVEGKSIKIQAGEGEGQESVLKGGSEERGGTDGMATASS